LYRIPRTAREQAQDLRRRRLRGGVGMTAVMLVAGAVARLLGALGSRPERPEKDQVEQQE